MWKFYNINRVFCNVRPGVHVRSKALVSGNGILFKQEVTISIPNQQ
ncbi:hypothetical protein HMPREF1146_0270 [Prevotella sp. MSX73]|nr:hypothetical protein HMPREF1146_0270 [Prevotella sp. MSX73]